MSSSRGPTVIVRWARSQRMHGLDRMDKAEFQRSKDDILGWIADADRRRARAAQGGGVKLGLSRRSCLRCERTIDDPNRLGRHDGLPSPVPTQWQGQIARKRPAHVRISPPRHGEVALPRCGAGMTRIRFSAADAHHQEPRDRHQRADWCEQCGAECPTRADYEIDHMSPRACGPPTTTRPAHRRRRQAALPCLPRQEDQARRGRDRQGQAPGGKAPRRRPGPTEIARRFGVKQERLMTLKGIALAVALLGLWPVIGGGVAHCYSLVLPLAAEVWRRPHYHSQAGGAACGESWRLRRCRQKYARHPPSQPRQDRLRRRRGG